MKEIKIFFGVLALMFISETFGQQDPQYTQYMYSLNIINPAYVGSKEVTSLGILGRTQWIGFEGAPRTLTLSMNAPMGRAVGLGFSVIHDEIGPVKENHVYADFSYSLITSDEGKLAFGLKAGVSFLNVRDFITVDPDPLNIPINRSSPNFGAGVYYYTSNFYVGLSVPNILETRHLEREAGIVSSASERMHYFFTTGFVFEIADNLKLKPSTMIKAALGAPTSVDLSSNLLVDDRFEVGLSYRIGDSFSGLVGFRVNEDFRIGYAYDYTTSRFGNFNSGSHEIMLLFDFNRKNIKSPRFF